MKRPEDKMAELMKLRESEEYDYIQEDSCKTYGQWFKMHKNEKLNLKMDNEYIWQ